MKNPIIKIHNAETNEIIEREMNDEELQQLLIDKAERQTALSKEKAKIAAKTELLQRLGITEDEAKLLLG